MTSTSDLRLLRLDFPPSLRENAILWLLGNFVVLVEQEVVSKNNRLDISSIKGLFRQKKDYCNHLAMPHIGPIPGIDIDNRELVKNASIF